MCSIESRAISTHTLTAWGGQPTMSRLRRGQISMDPSAPWDGQGDINQYDFPHTYSFRLLDNYFSTTAFNKCPYSKAKSIFSASAVREEVAEQNGGGGGKSRGEQSQADIRSAQGSGSLWSWGSLKQRLGLISGRALHYL